MSTAMSQQWFDICDLQVIGDLIVYSLVWMLSVQTRAGDGCTLRHLFSAFEFITVEYLAYLSVGLSDQAVMHKSNATRFKTLFKTAIR